ncbi:hypothetical protein VP01_1231g3 [Puccinia sorghi]|uniref:Uncharacterized protein n=1 Tax=Puccinia sorghi TaxID=27349 RepID=A0A0L6VPS4_9BASI|nr:hypothetical protein VP01_1231g3 [Puccinia sorghi]
MKCTRFYFAVIPRCALLTPGDPMADSAWSYLWSARNDRAFITTMGLDVGTFERIMKNASQLNGNQRPSQEPM